MSSNSIVLNVVLVSSRTFKYLIQQKKKKTKVFRSEMDGSSRTDRQQKM